MASVGEFMDRMAAMGWQDGERDCLLILGLWTFDKLGVDGGAEWRGHYRTPLGRERALRRSGGMAACIERGAKRAGLIELSGNPGELKPGAVGLVEVLTRRGVGIVGGIFDGARWNMLTINGRLSVQAVPVRAWNLPNG